MTPENIKLAGKLLDVVKTMVGFPPEDKASKKEEKDKPSEKSNLKPDQLHKHFGKGDAEGLGWD